MKKISLFCRGPEKELILTISALELSKKNGCFLYKAPATEIFRNPQFF